MYLRFIGRRHCIALAAVLLMVGSTCYSGLIKPVGARDIDARYFYIAAQSWASGESPYDVTRYKARYRATFNSEPDGIFAAYLPTLMPVILPMAPLPWKAAARLLEALNFSAAMLLIWASYRSVRELYGARPGVVHWAWLTLGMTMGGLPATIATGQTSLLITAACAIALLGCQLRNRLMVIAGTVFASAKPSLSAPILVFVFMVEPSQRKSLVVAGAVIGVFIAIAAVLDGNFVAHYLGGISAYNAIPNNDPGAQIGLGSFLAKSKLSHSAEQILSVAVFAISLTLAAVLYRKDALRGRGRALALTLVFFSTGILHTIHGYDVCIYAMGIALYSLLSCQLQMLYLVPTLFLWRPILISRAIPALTADDISNLGWLLMLAGCLYGVTRMLAMRLKNADA